MTEITQFIAGDWGTSNLRLYLCQYNNSDENVSCELLDTRRGPGISQIDNNFESIFFNLTQDWIDEYERIQILLSGMIGSNLGWKETPYLSCPVGARQIAQGRTQFKARGLEFSILCGLHTQNPLGEPDVMRGEELQILGWLGLQKQPPKHKLFALPGTHNKWVSLEDASITNFLTAFSGELFSVLRDNSILVAEKNAPNFNQEVFMQGVSIVEKLGQAQLVHALFSTRSKQLHGELASKDALSYLSGLIIAADVSGARHLFDTSNGVTIIAETPLAKRYQLVLNHFDIANQCCKPVDIAMAAYAAIFEQLNPRSN